METKTKTPKKVFISNNGCLELLLDSALFQSYFKNNQIDIVTDFKQADIILVGTCAFNKKMESASLKTIKKFNRLKKDSAKLIVHGCLPKINPDELRRVFTGDAFGPGLEYDLQNLFGFSGLTPEPTYNVLDIDSVDCARIRKLFHAFEKIRGNIYQRTGIKFFPGLDIKPLVGEGAVYNIKTSIGCLGDCAYCAVKFAKGRIKSHPVSKIYDEFQKGLDHGYRQFLLSGDDLGAYGRDIGEDLVQLLRRLITVKEEYKIILRDIEPDFLIMMFNDLKDIFLSGKIYSFSSPVQSGSNAVLKRMRRKYRAEDFLRCVRWVNTSSPSVKIRTAIMVGFPGEDGTDFKQSLDLLNKAKFDMVDIYVYSKRPHTAAESMNNHVGALSKKMRQIRIQLKVGWNIYFKALYPLLRRDRVCHDR